MIIDACIYLLETLWVGSIASPYYKYEHYYLIRIIMNFIYIHLQKNIMQALHSIPGPRVMFGHLGRTSASGGLGGVYFVEVSCVVVNVV